MTESDLRWARTIADIIRTTEETADELARLAAQTDDVALGAGLHDMGRNLRIEILRMQCHIADLCGGP